MKILKFHDVKTSPEFPYCIELINDVDYFDEVVECLWFATEKEQLEEFNKLLELS
jgi:hypothetical protein